MLLDRDRKILIATATGKESLHPFHVNS